MVRSVVDVFAKIVGANLLSVTKNIQVSLMFFARLLVMALCSNSGLTEHAEKDLPGKSRFMIGHCLTQRCIRCSRML